jgi:hypothetical protein
MQHYRAFELDHSGRLSGCINLVCDGDDDARRQAERLVTFHRIELWRLDRHVATFDVAAKQQPAAESSRR